jgi:hypothetical protein
MLTITLVECQNARHRDFAEGARNGELKMKVINLKK